MIQLSTGACLENGVEYDYARCCQTCFPTSRTYVPTSAQLVALCGAQTLLPTPPCEINLHEGSSHEIAIPVMSSSHGFGSSMTGRAYEQNTDTQIFLAVKTFFLSALALCIFLSCHVRSLWSGWHFSTHIPYAKIHCDLGSDVQSMQINFARG